ncbi:MAG: MFS transporter [Alphaproteobacteria bacterium]|jgi:MFS transporter, PPP family, 3-phenylpropionic acid transporter|nr:MFS transporter [Alphaproteobacteria bacterium]
MPEPTPPDKTRTALRMAFFYTAVFAMIGIHMPFWPVWLTARGMTPSDIGIIFAASLGAKVIINPLIAHMADRRGQRRPIMVVLSGLAFLVFTLFAWAEGFWQILLLSVLFFGVWSPLMPLGESLAMLGGVEANGEEHSIRGGELDYGRVRLWGSFAFIATVVCTGYFLGDGNVDIIYRFLVGSLAFVFVVTLFLPSTQAPSAADTRFAALEVLRDRRFVLFIIATALIQSSHSVYYGFGTLNWKAQAYSETVIGLLWAEGVIAEIILFAFGARMVAWMGPSKMIALGGLAGVVRWTVTGGADGLASLVIVQALHALTFAATHLGAIYFISRRIPPSLSASAQSLYSAVVMGFVLGLAMFASGKLFGLFGAGAYYAMAVLAAAGAIIAIFLAVLPRRDDNSA